MSLNDSSPPKIDQTHRVYALHVGFTFLLIFLAFNTSQNFQTSGDHTQIRSLGLALIYAFFTVTNLFAGAIVQMLGTKRSMIIGGSTYAFFVAANIHFITPLFLISTCVIGIGAAMLWTSQGSYMSKISARHERINEIPKGSTQALFSGYFFSLFQTSQTIGNLLVALLFAKNVEQWKIFLVLACICAIGVVSALPLFDIDSAIRSDAIDSGKRIEEAKPSWNRLRNDLGQQLSMFKDFRVQCLVPLFIFAGLVFVFFFLFGEDWLNFIKSHIWSLFFSPGFSVCPPPPLSTVPTIRAANSHL